MKKSKSLISRYIVSWYLNASVTKEIPKLFEYTYMYETGFAKTVTITKIHFNIIATLKYYADSVTT